MRCAWKPPGEEWRRCKQEAHRLDPLQERALVIAGDAFVLGGGVRRSGLHGRRVRGLPPRHVPVRKDRVVN